jgi:hypothetical protein
VGRFLGVLAAGCAGGRPRLLPAEVVLPDLANSLLVGTRLS